MTVPHTGRSILGAVCAAAMVPVPSGASSGP
jgi:hypothetical protein